MSRTLISNFDHFKNDFKKDTGLNVNKTTMGLYIQYYNARINDWHYQLDFETVSALLNLPRDIATAIKQAR